MFKSKYDAVRSAWNDGGPSAVIYKTRGWLAAQIAPDQAAGQPDSQADGPVTERPSDAGNSEAQTPQPSPTPVQSVAPAPEVISAGNVEYDEALAFFERRREGYERLVKWVAPYVEADGAFFDIGANVGYFTKLLVEETQFRGVAHLFEPIPNLSTLCVTTLAGLPCEVRIHEYGLGAEDATVDLYMDPKGNLGWNTMVADRASAGMELVRVNVRRFDETEIRDIPSFIKIDVEGAEYQVLAGLTPVIAGWPTRPAILCEIGWGNKHPQWDEELRAFADLEALGYRATSADGEPVDIASLTKTSDVLFLPS